MKYFAIFNIKKTLICILYQVDKNDSVGSAMENMRINGFSQLNLPKSLVDKIVDVDMVAAHDLNNHLIGKGYVPY